MNTTEHSFPLPEVESHKLDEAKEQILHPQSRQSVATFLQTNPWTAIALACATGLVAGMWFKSRAS